MCIHGYICNCPEGFFGDNCETEVDYCDPSPCENGGVCHDVVGGPGYSCICPSGFTGENCDVDIDECEAMPCQNGGNCTVSFFLCITISKRDLKTCSIYFRSVLHCSTIQSCSM